MKTTLDLPEELVRQLKLRAVQEGRRLKDLAAEFLAAGLSPQSEAPARGGTLVPKSLPKISARPAPAGNEKSMSAQEWSDWLKEVEQRQEVERHEAILGHQHVDRADD